MRKVQMFVAMHKAAPIPKDEVLVPIHVGRANYVRRKRGLIEYRGANKTGGYYLK